MRMCPSCGRPNAERAAHCATCGAEVETAGEASERVRPAEQARGAAGPGPAPPEFFTYRHTTLEVVAWLIWGLAIVSLVVFIVGVPAAFSDDGILGDTAAMWLFFGGLAFAVTSGTVVFLVTGLATNAFLSRNMQVLAGSSLWMLLFPMVVVWLVSVAVATLDGRASTRRFRGVMWRLVLGAFLVFLVFGLSLVAMALPLVGVWLAVMVWAPIQLARAAHRSPRPSAIPAPA